MQDSTMLQDSTILLVETTPALDLPRVIGHRGACGSAPENTLASIRQAASSGAEWIELDVTLSADRVPVTFHDLTLDRCTNGSGALRKKSWQELQELDAGAWFDSRYKGEKIPHLSDVIAEIQRLDLGFNLEIKPAPGWEEDTAHRAIDILETLWSPDQRHKLLISSFSEGALRVAQERVPWAAKGYLTIAPPNNWLARLNELGCETLNCHYQLITQELCQQAKAANIRILAYTVNDCHIALNLAQYGVDAIFSDYPKEMQATLA